MSKRNNPIGFCCLAGAHGWTLIYFMKQEYDVIIVGAGAAGLLAARELSKANRKVVLVEARDRIGGRIHTLRHRDSATSLELGAEFVHGNLPITFKLAAEADISVYPTAGETWRIRNGELLRGDELDEDWELFEEKLKGLQEDLPLKDFLNNHFEDTIHSDLKRSVERFAAGYDTADISRASTLGLRDEWLDEENGANDFRLKGGYKALLDFLLNELHSRDVDIFLSTIVREVIWKPGEVRGKTTDGREVFASRILITVPLGVLQADETELGAIKFSPQIAPTISAAKALGFGAIIKILLEFKTPFWEEMYPELLNMEFLLTDTLIPAWWTQFPDRSGVLTGWLGGPQASLFTHATPQEVLVEALKCLESSLKVPEEKLKEQLLNFRVANWTADPFTRGSYSYATVGAVAARKILNTPVCDTLFFAGEALYGGVETGTVEAAFASALNSVNQILKNTS